MTLHLTTNQNESEITINTIIIYDERHVSLSVIFAGLHKRCKVFYDKTPHHNTADMSNVGKSVMTEEKSHGINHTSNKFYDRHYSKVST